MSKKSRTLIARTNSPDSTMRVIIQKRMLNLLTLIIPIIFYFIPKTLAIIVLLPLTLFVVFVDYNAGDVDQLRGFFLKIFKKTFNVEELEAMSLLKGTSYFMMGITIPVLFFNKRTALEAMFIFIICDTMAGVFGRYFGKTKLIGKKTLEGSIAFIMSGFITIIIINTVFYPFSFLNVIIGFAGVIVAAIVELFAKHIHIDDNIIIPVVYALAVSFMRM